MNGLHSKILLGKGGKDERLQLFLVYLSLTGLLLYLSSHSWIIMTKTIKWKMRCSCFFSLTSSHLRLSKLSLDVIWFDLISWWTWYWLNRWKAANILSSFNFYSHFTLNHSLPSLISLTGLSSLLACRLYEPSQPADTKELGITASTIKLGLSPFRSRLARQPSNPCRDWICFGKGGMMSLGAPPATFRKPLMWW